MTPLSLRKVLAAVSRPFVAVPRVIRFYQGSPYLAVKGVFGIWMREGIEGVARRAEVLLGGSGWRRKRPFSAVDLYGELPVGDAAFNPKVSVIVPNYNHAPYLRQRLESIYAQTYKNVEVILLDDHSGDASVEILEEFANRFPDRTTCLFNNSNSGGVFHQWKKGLEVAVGELIWIAESDDFCSENFIAEQIRAFQNPAVVLSFCNTKFVSEDSLSVVWTLGEYLSDLGMANWDQPFIRSAHSLVCGGWGIKNIVPNVSGALFRHPHHLPLLDDPRWLSLRLCGDWVFYLSVIRGGLVAYIPGATNFYRQHERSTSQIVQKKDLYYAEHEIVASCLASLYRLDRGVLEMQRSTLYGHWCSHRGTSSQVEFRRLYDLDRVWARSVTRKPNVVMAVYALIAGGGETFPIMLANLLRARGYAITLLNCGERPTEPGILGMLDPRIPRLELPDLRLAGAVFSDMGIEIVHSHHAWVDLALANLLRTDHGIGQVVTMHGMYETIPPAQLTALMPLLSRRIDHFVYTADKNLAAFPASFRQLKKLSRISNALPAAPIAPVSRACLGIAPGDFALCMVARAIPEKGWEEAIQAVNWANVHSTRRICLLLIGDGPEFDRLHDVECSGQVRFLGFRSDVRNYFATCDMGFLPSRFKGESAPLVVIDCLFAGRPVLASDIGEIRSMLDTPDGLAGALLDVNDLVLDVEAIGRTIADLANSPSRYLDMCSRVASAAAKFSATAMVDSYEEVYRTTLGWTGMDLPGDANKQERM